MKIIAIAFALLLTVGCASKPSTLPTYISQCERAGNAALDLRNGKYLQRFKCGDRIEWLQAPLQVAR